MNEIYGFEANPYVLEQMQRQPRTGMLRNILARGVSSWSEPRLNEGYDPSKIPTGPNTPYQKAGFFRSILGDESNMLNAAAAQRFVDMQHAQQVGDRNIGAINKLADAQSLRQGERDRTLHGYDVQRDKAMEEANTRTSLVDFMRDLFRDDRNERKNIAAEKRGEKRAIAAETRQEGANTRQDIRGFLRNIFGGNVEEAREVRADERREKSTEKRDKARQAHEERLQEKAVRREAIMRPLGEGLINMGDGTIVQIDPIDGTPKVVWPLPPAQQEAPQISPEELKALEDPAGAIGPGQFMRRLGDPNATFLGIPMGR